LTREVFIDRATRGSYFPARSAAPRAQGHTSEKKSVAHVRFTGDQSTIECHLEGLQRWLGHPVSLGWVGNTIMGVVVLAKTAWSKVNIKICFASPRLTLMFCPS